MSPVRADQVTVANLAVRPRKKVTRAPERADLLVAAATARRRQVQLVQALRAVPVPVAPTPPPAPVPRLTSVAEPWVYVGNVSLSLIHAVNCAYCETA
jgi:hypothetical protein